MKKVVYEFKCACCGDVIDEDNYEETWADGKSLFCSQECIARWNGQATDEEIVEDWDDFVEQFIRYAVTKPNKVKGYFRKVNGKKQWVKSYKR